MKTTSLTVRGFVLSSLALAIFTVLFTLPNMASARVSESEGEGNTRSELRQSARGMARASTTVDATCMAGAVETRETALISAWGELNTSLTSALTDRKTALVAAWNMSSQSERSTALKTAWKEWKTEKKAANTEFRKDRTAAWDAFKKTAKDTCRTSVPKEESLEKVEKDSVAL